ncbi:PaaI family thioesterase [Rhizobium alvei]|uniref:PaaI family thioesterase n=1 Tax=Rhizobium alvei TaxID=1132659 RepID=A0ABT8YJN0_9HYPH|nr:PaaI family thioesterase [Rhizobium alvei]MDO6963809.1 PaaI family thioesterase [Rhizobium alvei]
MTPILTAEQINALLERDIPQIVGEEPIFRVINVASGTCTLRFSPNESHLRHGGTISGPSMFALADLASYVTLLAHIGPRTEAVTANLNISFLHRPDPVPLDGIGRILKIGKQLSVMEVMIERVDNRQLIAHATSTFSVPARKT